MDNMRLRNRLLTVLAVFVGVVASVSVGFGMSKPLQASAAEKKVIRVGYIDYVGFIEPMENGNYTGYAVQYLNEIAKYTGWKYEYVHGDWNDILTQVEEGKIDLICQAQKTPEREQRFLFSKYSDGSEGSVLYTRVDNTDLYYNDFEDYNGMKVAMLEGSFQNESFKTYADQKGFTYTPVYYGNEDACYQALDAGEVDGVAMGALAGKNDYRVLCRFGSDPFYFITGKNNEDLMTQINNAMEEILGLEPNFNTELYAEYYSSREKSVINFTKAEANYIANAGVITVGQLRNRYAISNINSKTGELEGISEDILNQISEMTGLKFKNIPVPADTKPVDALRAGDFDMVMGIFRTENFLTDPTLQVSNSYFDTTLTIVMRDGETYNPNSNYVVALKSSFQAMQEYIANEYPQFTIKLVTEDDEGLQALLKGDVDIMVQNEYTLNYLMQKPQYEKLQIMPTSFLAEQDCIATLADTDPCLMSILNKAMAAISQSEIDSYVMSNTTAQPYRYTTADLWYKYHVPLLIVLVLLTCCFALLGNVLRVRKNNEKTLEIKNKQLAGAVAAADRASVAKSQFLSRMSHEIRTPMNAIVGLTTIAKQHEDDPGKIDDYLGKIETSSKVLLNIINDVLDMSAIESNKLKIAHEPFDIKQVLTGISTIYYPQCESKGVKFLVASDVENEYLIGDSLRLNQVLLNLISNAYKFTDRGGEIALRVEESGKQNKKAFFRFIVSDTGIGMSKDMLERLFVPFEQEDATTAKKHGGSGLGLSIAKNLVDMMSGAIKVQSEQGKGTTFTIDIPFDISKEVGIENSESLRSIRVLVVDDEETSLEYAGIVLRRLGAPFETANSGKVALEMIEKAKANNKPYDVVLLDWKMPEMSGVMVAKEIRARNDMDTTIIIASAYDLSQVEDEAKAAGANYFVTKPLFQSTLFNVLMQLSGGSLHTEPKGEADQYDFTGHKVLLAEDNELNAEIATELLELVNMGVDHAENGEKAVELFEKSEPHTYDAILMDVQMPVMDGYGATKAIRALERPDSQEIPIYAMTANAFTEDVSLALSAGMNGHIAKPIDVAVMYKTLADVIAKQSDEQHD